MCDQPFLFDWNVENHTGDIFYLFLFHFTSNFVPVVRILNLHLRDDNVHDAERKQRRENVHTRTAGNLLGFPGNRRF